MITKPQKPNTSVNVTTEPLVQEHALMSRDATEEVCDAFFARLDATTPAPGSVITKDDDKAWLETRVLRALDRIASAQYHRDRILALAAEIEAKRAALETRSEQGDCSPRQGASTHVGVSWSPREMAYELDAFLGALRSAIDFIANVFANYLKGFGSVRSITKLLKQIDQSSEPIWLLLKKWKPWIKYVKNYRDKYVHYRTLRGTVGIVVRTKDGVTASAVRPYVIPQHVGEDVPDTRGARTMEHEIPEGINENWSQLSITGESGTETSLHLEYRRAPGYVTPDAFTTEHLDQLTRFFGEAIAFVTGRDFAPIIMSAAPN